MTIEDTMGLTWEHGLVLRLPRPIFVGAVLIAMCLSSAYLSFQLFFDFQPGISAFGIIVLLVALLVAPVFFFGSYDHQQYEAPSFRIARKVIQTSRFAGAVGVLAFIGLWEVLLPGS